MPSSTKNMAAIEQANELLHKICPAMKAAGRGKRRGLPKIEDVLLLPFFLEDLGGGKSELRLSKGRKSTLLTYDNYRRVPAGTYRLHVYDTSIESQAAIHSLESYGLGFDIACNVLDSGEGVLFVQTSEHAGAGNNEETLDVENKLQFNGDDGSVEIAIIDHRADLASMNLSTNRRRIATSLSYSGKAVMSILYECSNDATRIRDRNISVERGRLIANIIKRTCCDVEALRTCQISLERVPGALVSIGSVSVDNVKEQLDEMLYGLENAMRPPSNEDIHDLILKMSRNIHSEHDRVAQDVVWAALHNNMLSPL